MPPWNVMANVWKNLQELDLRPIREAAEKPVRLVIVGDEGAGKHTLAGALRSDTARPHNSTQASAVLAGLDEHERTAQADLIILMLDSTRHEHARERALARQWSAAGQKFLVFYNKLDLVTDVAALPDTASWAPERALLGSALDRAFLENEFATAISAMMPEDRLALGRRFPLLRKQIAQELINETSVSNATYALTTGMAEIVPMLNIPLNVADMVVLTKGQALLVYKLGLALGLQADWQYYLSEFGGVVGGGLVWRQLARSLVGFIPAFGIAPKVAIAYAGTYVIGQMVLQWYLTGRHVSRGQMQALYRQALEQGKRVARTLLTRAPRLPRLRRRKVKELAATTSHVCANCGTANDVDAEYCKRCGQFLGSQVAQDITLL